MNNVDVNSNSETRKTKMVKGILCNAGSDFIDVLQKDDTVITVMRNHVRNIKWPDPDCNPCDCGRKHDCRCDQCCSDDHHCVGFDCRCDLCMNQHRLGHNCACEGLAPHTCIPVCHGRVSLRLAGLTDRLTFNLQANKGCPVIIECS
jgi:hypothetical protein